MQGASVEDNEHKELESREPEVQSARASNAIFRDGKTITRVEVVLPRWRDVFHSKLCQATSQPPLVEQHGPPDTVSSDGDVPQTPEHDVIKLQPIEDSNPELDKVSVYSPADLARAIQQMRNVSYQATLIGPLFLR